MSAAATTAAAVTAFQAMFLYSGFDKMRGFENKVRTLQAKFLNRLSIEVPTGLATAGMIAVILLEIVGSLFLMYVALRRPTSQVWKDATKLVIACMVAFVVVVTLLYHIPDKRVIPLLSNLTTASGFVLMYQVLA